MKPNYDHDDIEQARQLVERLKSALMGLEIDLCREFVNDWYDMSDVFDCIKQFNLDLDLKEQRLKDWIESNQSSDDRYDE